MSRSRRRIRAGAETKPTETAGQGEAPETAVADASVAVATAETPPSASEAVQAVEAPEAVPEATPATVAGWLTVADVIDTEKSTTVVLYTPHADLAKAAEIANYPAFVSLEGKYGEEGVRGRNFDVLGYTSLLGSKNLEAKYIPDEKGMCALAIAELGTAAEVQLSLVTMAGVQTPLPLHLGQPKPEDEPEGLGMVNLAYAPELTPAVTSA